MAVYYDADDIVEFGINLDIEDASTKQLEAVREDLAKDLQDLKELIDDLHDKESEIERLDEDIEEELDQRELQAEAVAP